MGKTPSNKTNNIHPRHVVRSPGFEKKNGMKKSMSEKGWDSRKKDAKNGDLKKRYSKKDGLTGKKVGHMVGTGVVVGVIL